MIELTKQQEKVFVFINTFITKNGFPPTYKDIATHFGFASEGTVKTYLEHLERKGYIQRLGKARGLKILRPITEKSIPILGRIAAGPLKDAIEDNIGLISDIKELHNQSGRFALMVNGDSMKDAGILNGDLAIIQSDVTVQNGQIAAVMVEDSATLKRVYFEKNKVRLQPENEFYTPIELTKSDFTARVIGRYIALIRKA